MKISVIQIVREHINSLRNFDTGKLGLEAIVILIILPLAAGIGASIAHPEVGEAERTGLILFFAVYGAALPIAIVQLPMIMRRRKGGYMASLGDLLAEETITNMSFGVVVCIAAISALMLDAVVDVMYMTTFLAYSHVALLLLTLRMVVKRLNIISVKEVEPKQPA